MKILIEPKRSIIPENYHKTNEYSFDLDIITTETLEQCLSTISPIPDGMCGVSVIEKHKKPNEFFITLDKGKLQSWR